MTYTWRAELPHHISDGQSNPSLRNSNKKTTLCIRYNEQDPARNRLKSRHSFLHSVEPLGDSARTRRLTLWSSHLQTTPHKLSFSPTESLPPGSNETRPTWSNLNRLRVGTGRMQIPYVEMGIQRGWTENVRMWE